MILCISSFSWEIIRRFKINILQWLCDLKADFNAPLQKKNFSFDKESFKNISIKLHESDGFVFVVPEWGGMVPSQVKNIFL